MALALYEWKAETCRERGLTFPSMWVHEILWASKYRKYVLHLITPLRFWFMELCKYMALLVKTIQKYTVTDTGSYNVYISSAYTTAAQIITPV